MYLIYHWLILESHTHPPYPPGPLATRPQIRHDDLLTRSNTRLWWDLGPARALGYEPQDDSEKFAAKLIAELGELDPDNPAHANLGGPFCTDPPIWPY